MILVRDLEWAAGFLEGEGCFYNSTRSDTVGISAAQVQREPLEKLQRLFGGSIHCTPSKHLKWNTYFRWAANGTVGAGLSMTLYPLLSSKRQAKIRQILGRWRTHPCAPKFKSPVPKNP